MKEKLTILLAPDSFKESMTAKEACEAMERGIKKANSSITCIHVPMADGGEGTMQSLVDATGGRIYSINVIGPLGNEVAAFYGILGDGVTGILEMASASGIQLVPPERRNPLITTTYGTGQLIKACLDHGIKKLLIGIGGSATNDGGAGVVQALGGRLLDRDGREITYGGGQLGKDVIDVPGAGAAGGLGAGLMAFLNGTLKKGIEMVIEYSDLEEKVKEADMVWTGEGSIDFQTQYGKTPLGVARIAKKCNKPVIALAGRVENNIEVLYENGIDAIFCIMRGVTPLKDALEKGKENIDKTAENIIRLMNLI